MNIKLKDPARFGQEILDRFADEGWQSLGKRDLELLVYILLEKDGAISRADSNYAVARQLRVTVSKAAALRRDAYARWRPLINEQPADVVKRILAGALNEEQLKRTAQYATERRMSDGFLPLLVEHPDDRAELEHAIKEIGAIPIYERNREVILINYETLFAMADALKLMDQDPAKVQKGLAKIFAGEKTLQQFLTTPVEKLTWQDARHALNLAGAAVVEGSLKDVTSGLLKLAFPFIK